jgi:hypothetical protein
MWAKQIDPQVKSAARPESWRNQLKMVSPVAAKFM